MMGSRADPTDARDYSGHFLNWPALAEFLKTTKFGYLKISILGLIDKVGLEVGGEVIKHRAYAQDIQAVIGGKATHPVCGLPGGMSKPITEEERTDFEEKAKSLVEFGKFSLKLFNDLVLANKEYLELITGDIYTMNSYYMGMVDNNNKVNF
ncbi:unnamed protein product, partial [marine sediment metagenome]